MHDAEPIDKDVEFQGSKVHIGRYTYGWSCIKILTYEQGASLTIGAFCSLAMDVKILLGGEHVTDRLTTWPFWHPKFADKLGSNALPTSGTKGGVSIGNDVWIGHSATILSGITVGNGAIIAANAHVIKDVPDFAVVGGNPAKIIRYRMSEDLIPLMNELAWWDLPDDKIKEIAGILYNEKPDESLIRKLISTYR